MNDDTQRQLEAANQAIEARAREVEDNGEPTPLDMRTATEGRWGPVPARVHVTYERHLYPDQAPAFIEALQARDPCELERLRHEAWCRDDACPTCDGTGGDHQIGCQP